MGSGFKGTQPYIRRLARDTALNLSPYTCPIQMSLYSAHPAHLDSVSTSQVIRHSIPELRQNSFFLSQTWPCTMAFVILPTPMVCEVYDPLNDWFSIRNHRHVYAGSYSPTDDRHMKGYFKLGQ